MKNLQSCGLILLSSLLLFSACDLVGIGGGDDEEKETVPSLAWKLDYVGGTLGAPPIIDQGEVYVWGFELMSVDLESGSTKWKTIVFKESYTIDDNRKMLITDQAVIAGKPDEIKAYRKSDGEPLWETDTGFNYEGIDSLDVSAFLLAQTPNHIFAVFEQALIGLDESTGNRDMDITLDATISGIQAEEIRALAAEKDGSLLFAATQYSIDGEWPDAGRVIAIDPNNGRTVWSKELSVIVNDSTATTPDDLVLANGMLVVLANSEVVALEPETGNRIWQTTLEGSEQWLLAADNAVFVSGFGGSSLRLDSRNGNVQWKTIAPEFKVSFNFEPLVWDDGYLYHPKFKNITFGISIINAEDGKSERFLLASDIKNVDFDFGFFGGMAVQNSFMVRQGPLNTYGIKL